MTIIYVLYAVAMIILASLTLSSRGFNKFKYFCLFMAAGLLGAAIIQIMHME